MRVITGKYKGRRFEIPHSFKARPTTDFAKENLFNVLKAYTDFEGTRVLDLFAGTGSISLEFLSRGCTQVVSVEKDYQHYCFIRSIMKKLEEEASIVLHTDALKYIHKAQGGYDIIFADPPYMLKEMRELPDRVLNSELLLPEGIFILEHGKTQDFTEHPSFIEHREYGSVNFSFFKKTGNTDNPTHP